MTQPLRRRDLVQLATDATVPLRDRHDYIIRSHEFVEDTRPHRRGGLIATVRTWRRRCVTRRQLSLLDARGLADVGLDAGTRDREIAKPFWQL